MHIRTDLANSQKHVRGKPAKTIEKEFKYLAGAHLHFYCFGQD